jgi:protein-tyrosine-phosphatase
LATNETHATYEVNACRMTESASLNIVTLCTGNAARSVMLGYMLTTLAEESDHEWRIRTAGTHVTEGVAMSGRTRDALMKIEELRHHPFGAHRSHQLSSVDCEWANVVLAAEADNVHFARKTFASSANKAVQLAQFDRYASNGNSFEANLRAVAAHEPSVEFNVRDPAGADQDVYDACARELWVLAQRFSVIVHNQSVD